MTLHFIGEHCHSLALLFTFFYLTNSICSIFVFVQWCMSFWAYSYIGRAIRVHCQRRDRKSKFWWIIFRFGSVFLCWQRFPNMNFRTLFYLSESILHSIIWIRLLLIVKMNNKIPCIAIKSLRNVMFSCAHHNLRILWRIFHCKIDDSDRSEIKHNNLCLFLARY